jgi:hypothetical protein
MKKRLGAFLLAIIMTLSVGVMAPVAYADDAETPVLAVSDGKITKASSTGSTATLDVTLKDTLTTGVGIIQFTVTPQADKLTAGTPTSTTGTISKGSTENSYVWTAKDRTNVKAADTVLFSITAKRASSDVLDDDYTVDVESTAAYAFTDDEYANSVLGKPAKQTGTVTIDGVLPPIAVKTQPSAPSKSLAVGASATVKTVITNNAGGTLTYAWYTHTVGDDETEAPVPANVDVKDDKTWTACTTEGNATETLTLDTAKAGTYYVFCKITDGTNTAYTNAVKYTVGATALKSANIVFSFKDGDADVTPSATNTVPYIGKEYTAAIDDTETAKAVGTAVASGETKYYKADDETNLKGTNAGTYEVPVTGSGNLSGTVTATWTITPATMKLADDDAKITVTKDGTITAADIIKILKDKVITTTADQASIEVTFGKLSTSGAKVLSLNSAKDTATAIGVGEDVELPVKVTADNYTAATLTFKVTVEAKQAATLKFDLATDTSVTQKDGKYTLEYTSDGTALEKIVAEASVTSPTSSTEWTYDSTKMTYTLTSGKKVTTYDTFAELKAETVKNLGDYTVTANYEDASYMGTAKIEFTIVKNAAGEGELGAITVNADNELDLYVNNLNDITYGTSITAIKKAITKAYSDASAGLALAKDPVNVQKLDNSAYGEDNTILTAALNTKKTSVTATLVAKSGSKTDSAAEDAVASGTYYVVVYFTSDNYDSIAYMIPVVIKEKATVSITFSKAAEEADVSTTYKTVHVTYTGKAQTYEKATASLTGTKLKGKITYTYDIYKTGEESNKTAADKNSSLDNSKPKTAGQYTVTASYDDGTNQGSETIILVIDPKPLTITSATVKKSYDGSTTLAASDITKGKISGVVKGETLTAGKDYNIVSAKDDGKDAFTAATVGTKYKVDLKIAFVETNGAKTAAAANYTFTTNKTVKASIVAKEITIKIGVKDASTGKGTETIDDKPFTGKAITLGDDLYVWTEDTLPAATTADSSSTDTGSQGAANAVTLMAETTESSASGTAITLDATKDYTVKYSNNTKAGKATITVSPKSGSNYTFKKTTANFNIVTNPMKNNSNDDGTSKNDVYTATVKDVTITYGTTPADKLLSGTVKLAGSNTAIKGKWTWDDAEAVSKLNVQDAAQEANVTFTPTNKSYSAVKTTVKVTVKQATLTISDAKVADSTYDTTMTTSTPIDTTNVSDVKFKVGKTELTVPAVSGDVTDGYTVVSAFYNKTTIGTQKVTVKIQLAGSYATNYKLAKDTYTTTGKIAGKSVTPVISFTDANIESKGLDYTGKALKPAITVAYNAGTADAKNMVTIPTSEYTVKYTNNTNVGEATVTVTLKKTSNYTFDNKSTATATFAINQVTPTLTVKDITTTYTGKAADKSLIKGTAKAGKTTVKGTWSFTTYDSTATPAMTELKTDAGTYTNISVTFTPKDTKNYATATKTITVKINPITVKVKKVTLASADVNSIVDKKANVTITFDKSGLTSSDYTVAATYPTVAAGTQTVSYTVTLSNSNYTFKSGSTYTGTVKGKLTGEIKSTTTTTTTTTTGGGTGSTEGTGGTGGT